MEDLMNRKLKRSLAIATPFIIFLVFTYIWIGFAKPYVLKLITEQIPKLNQVQNIVHIEVGSTDISLLKLQLSASQVVVNFKDESLGLKPINVEDIAADVDIFNLIVGRINISKINIHKALVGIEIKESATPFKPLQIPIEKIFSFA